MLSSTPAAVRDPAAAIGAPASLGRGPRAAIRGPCTFISLNVYFLQVAHALAREPRSSANFSVADQRVTRAGPQKTAGCLPSGAIARFHTLDVRQNSFTPAKNVDPGPEENHPL